MLIKLWVEDTSNTDGDIYSRPNGRVLEDLGTCVTDNPRRASEMYADYEIKWADKGYNATINWEVLSPPQSAAASILGKARSERKTEAARKNSKLGGWPKGRPRKTK